MVVFSARGERNDFFSETTQRLLELPENLRDCQKTDQHRDEANAFEQLEVAERQALGAGDWIEADTTDQHAEKNRDDALPRAATIQGYEAHQGEQYEDDILRRTEANSDGRQRAGAENQADVREGIAEYRRIQDGMHRLAPLSALRQGISVDDRRGSRRCAWRAQQDRRHAAAEKRSFEHGQHHGNADPGIEVKAERNQQCDRHRSGQAGDRAEQLSEDDTNEDSGQGIDAD